jgi:hypothetical protein
MKIKFRHAEWVSALNEKAFSPHDIVQIGKEVGAKFNWHPLGFIICKLSEEGEKTIRLHIWPNNSNRVQEPAWLIHDHLFDLKSWVLSGKIENTEYEITNDNPNFSVYQASYDKEKSILHRTDQKLSIKVKHKTIINTGGIYQVSSGVLHQSVSLSKATSLTICETINKFDKSPIIAGDISGMDIYSYTRSIVSDNDLYEIIGNI